MTETELLERNLELQASFMRYVFEHPDILDWLPDDFHLVILPIGDPELARKNLEMAHSVSDGRKPLVLVRLKSLHPFEMESLVVQDQEGSFDVLAEVERRAETIGNGTAS